jgi:hypothetical protein
MKQLFTIMTLLIALALPSFGQTPNTNAPTFVKGNIDIKYNSRAANVPTKGVKDLYTVNVNVCDSALFKGTITDQPQIIEGMISKSVTQPRVVGYDINLDVVNPKNPSQTKNVGRLFGIVPIAPDGVYKYDAGTLTVDVLPIGQAPGFSSKFAGSAIGKPMNRPADWLETFKGNAVSITRSVGGKQMTVLLKKYDRMQFQNVVIGAGPVQNYPQITVNGEMLYDYDKECWFFNNVSLMYGRNRDTLTGTIRWVASPQRKSNGEGEYQFDVRVNEPPPSESAAFAAPSDESAFFENDTTIPALVGTMKYKDSVRNDTTLASMVTIDLKGNSLTKQQVMALTKVIIFASVVPMNAD